MVPLSVVLHLPSILFMVYTIGPLGKQEPVQALLGALLANVCGAILTAPVTVAVFAQSMNRGIGASAIRQRSIAALPGVVAASLLYGLINLPASAPAIFGDAEKEPLLLLLAMAIGLVMLIFVQPGLIAMLPAAVVERLSPVGALQRSWSLTRGSRKTIFWLIILFVLVLIAAGMALGIVAGIFAVASTGGMQMTPTTIAVTATLPAAIVAGLWASLATIVYRDLRVAKEGVPQEQVVAVFD